MLNEDRGLPTIKLVTILGTLLKAKFQPSMAHSQMAGYHAVGHSTAAGLLEEQTPRQG